MLLIYIAATKQTKNLGYLFVAALFIALGRSGRDISLKSFLANQCKEEWSLVGDDEDEERIQSIQEIYWRIASITGIIVSIYISWDYKDMELVELSKISAIAMGVGFAFFLAGTRFYHPIKPPPLNSEIMASQILRAAIRKKNLNKIATPSTSASASDNSRRMYRDMFLSWVDRAAIIEPSPSIHEQERRGRLHAIEQVREVKKMLSLIPLWMTFLVYGLLQATASVFFYEQVSYVNPRVGVLVNVPVEIFAAIVSLVSFIVSYICEKWMQHHYRDNNKPPRHAMAIRLGCGLAVAPVCSVIAWRVESYRIEKSVKSDVAIDVVWLIPQFVLLGILDGLVSDGMEEFFYANVSKPLRKYGPFFTQVAPNIGHFVSLALVLNLRSLFGDSLDTSSLGLYYAVIGYVCFVNFMFYCFIATHFVRRREGEAYAEDDGMIADEEGIVDQGMEELFQYGEGIIDQGIEEVVQHEEGIVDKVMEELPIEEVEDNNQDTGNQEADR